eukprot:14531281-Alexandrium_andersonii.AAC.1
MHACNTVYVKAATGGGQVAVALAVLGRAVENVSLHPNCRQVSSTHRQHSAPHPNTIVTVVSPKGRV